jgi:serine/threonine protein kinase
LKKRVAIKIQVGGIQVQEKQILDRIQETCKYGFLCIDSIYTVDYGKGGISIIVMEYIQFILSDNIPIERKSKERMMDSLYKVTKRLHSLGIAHKDLKPENIAIDKNFNVKLLDYGLSCITDQCRWSGTQGYIHPYLMKYIGEIKSIDLWKENDFYGIYKIGTSIGLFKADDDSDKRCKIAKMILKSRFKNLDNLEKDSMDID